MDASGVNGVGDVAKTTVDEAARILGIKEESVRKRVRRGTMRFEKCVDGRLYVYLDNTEAVRDGNRDVAEQWYGYRSRDESGSGAREVLEAKNETIRILKLQLEEEREARKRADTIIAQLTRLNVALTARLPGVEGPPAGLLHVDVGASATAEGEPMAAESGPPWWRRRLGGG
jgi:excisionase family DNA binding protein